MKKIFYIVFEFIKNLEAYKFYHIIIIFTITLVFLLFANIYDIYFKIKETTNQNKILVTKDIEYTIAKWLQQRANELENSAKLLAYTKIYKDRQSLSKLHEVIKSDNFDAIQILIPNDIFYFNGMVMIDYKSGFRDKNTLLDVDPLKTSWFINTKTKLQTTIEHMPRHGYFKEKTMNICTPISQDNNFFGVLCGIIKIDLLFRKIKELNIPKEIFYFVINKKGTMLISTQNEKTKNIILNFYKQHKFNFNKKNMNFLDSTISIKKINEFDWYVGVGISKRYLFNKWIEEITKNFVFLIGFFILFLIVVNSAYEFLYLRVKRKKDEYEKILHHRSRLNEIGELISSINHQLKQPLNSLSLVLSNIYSLQENKLLDEQTLKSNLLLCKKSIKLMDKTIDIFKNFYICNFDIKEFLLESCIDGVLHVNYVNFSKNNIKLEFNRKRTENLKVCSIENYIQQILLVLILNAQDALANAKDKKICIKVTRQKDKFFIDIADFGCGIDDKQVKSIFSKIKYSKNDKGFGIGLVFAKKLAKEKLMGDLSLICKKNPTIFRLEFKNLKELKC